MNRELLKSKMLSFRVSPEDYLALQKACHTLRLPGLSEVARAAIKSFIAEREKSITMAPMKTRLRQYWNRWEVEVEMPDGSVQVAEFSGEEPDAENNARAFLANPKVPFPR